MINTMMTLPGSATLTPSTNPIIAPKRSNQPTLPITFGGETDGENPKIAQIKQKARLFLAKIKWAFNPNNEKDLGAITDQLTKQENPERPVKALVTPPTRVDAKSLFKPTLSDTLSSLKEVITSKLENPSGDYQGFILQGDNKTGFALINAICDEKNIPLLKIDLTNEVTFYQDLLPTALSSAFETATKMAQEYGQCVLYLGPEMESDNHAVALLKQHLDNQNQAKQDNPPNVKIILAQSHDRVDEALTRLGRLEVVEIPTAESKK